MKQMSRMFLLLSITVLMAGCKLAVILVEGGEVHSTGSGTCVAGMICFVDVDDPNFSETFTALPDASWYFQKWNSGHKFFCGNSANPECAMSFQGYEEHEAVEKMVASSEMFYLMPVFKPYQETVRVDGKEWMQPYLFLNLSWKKINAVCPGGACAGKLNGYDMTGWRWASVDDFNALLNYYLGTNVGPGPYSSGVTQLEWVHRFANDGWRESYGVVEGWLRDLHNESNAYYASVQSVGFIEGHFWGQISTIEDEIFHKFEMRGGWFYRTY